MKRELFVQMNYGVTGQKTMIRRMGNKISFSQKRDFERFVKNMEILNTIKSSNPQSIYALAKLEKKDVANVAKIVSFYEKLGVLKMKLSLLRGRKVKTPFVEFDQISFAVRGKLEPRSGKAFLGLVRRR